MPVISNTTSTYPWQNTKLLDFRSFLYVVWKHLNLPDPTPLQYDIANYLQTGPKRKIIEAFRGVGKSWITSAYTLWRLYWNPQLNILVVSASKERADSFSTFTMRLISEMDILKPLVPDFSRGQRASKIAFDVGPANASHAPSVKSAGIYGQITGSRADIIIADDVEIPNNSYTQMMRDKLSEAVKEFDAIIKPEGDTEITYLGTPQVEMSLYNILRDRGYSTRIWPARVPDNSKRLIYGERLAPYIAKMDNIGHSTDPERFTDGDLREREASYGRSGFALQFMLDTSLSDAERFPLRLSDLSVMPLDKEMAPEKVVWSSGPELLIRDLPSAGFTGDGYHRPMSIQGEFREYTGSVMFIDPSGRGKDETAYAVVKMLNGQLFVTACNGHNQGYAEKGMKELVRIAKENKVNRILIESNFGDGMFQELLRPYLNEEYPVATEEVRSSKQKELRIIDTLEPVMNQHRLIFDRSVVEQDYATIQKYPEERAREYLLGYQMTRITRERGALVHDDRLDALAGAVAYWVNVMGVDQQAQIDEQRRADMQAAIDIFSTDERSSEAFDILCMIGDAQKALKLTKGNNHVWCKPREIRYESKKSTDSRLRKRIS